jgi:hypothetical protein
MQTTSENLFSWAEILPDRARPHSTHIQLPGNRHPCVYDLDLTADYQSWVAPADLWWRENGKEDSRFRGNETMPLLRCIRNLNMQARTRGDEFVWRSDTLATWAAGAECTVPFLAAAILADTEHRLRDTYIYHRIVQLVDQGYWA